MGLLTVNTLLLTLSGNQTLKLLLNRLIFLLPLRSPRERCSVGPKWSKINISFARPLPQPLLRGKEER